MSAHSEEAIKKFCVLCDELFSVWQLRKHLFDENPSLAELTGPRHGHLFLLLQDILQESWVHKLAKLHDPAVQRKAINLSIPYIVEYGNWSSTVQKELNELQAELNSLSDSLRPARNKVTAHNDLATLLDEKAVGVFGAGKDELYFEALKKFASVASQIVLRIDFDYTDLVRNDVEIFMHDFVKGMKCSLS